MRTCHAFACPDRREDSPDPPVSAANRRAAHGGIVPLASQSPCLSRVPPILTGDAILPLRPVVSPAWPLWTDWGWCLADDGEPSTASGRRQTGDPLSGRSCGDGVGTTHTRAHEGARNDAGLRVICKHSVRIASAPFRTYLLTAREHLLEHLLPHRSGRRRRHLVAPLSTWSDGGSSTLVATHERPRAGVLGWSVMRTGVRTFFEW